MAHHNITGKHGEAEALVYLRQKGYRIVETNWRYGKAEIDIIAEHPDYIAMVEVKTRSADTYGAPQEFVNRKKQKMLIKAADHYAQENALEKDVYFDIIAITLYPEYKLEHIHQAFYP